MFDTYVYHVSETNESVQKYLLILLLFCYLTFFLNLMNVMTHKTQKITFLNSYYIHIKEPL